MKIHKAFVYFFSICTIMPVCILGEITAEWETSPIIAQKHWPQIPDIEDKLDVFESVIKYDTDIAKSGENFDFISNEEGSYNDKVRISKEARLKSHNFSAYWNSPTELCKSQFGIDIDPRAYGIKENKNRGWVGEEITIFYAKDLGLYPYIEEDAAVNGGIPQLVDLHAHFAKVKKDVQRFIPDEHFSGLGVLDWERWCPQWERRTKPYEDLSMTLVKFEHPDWPRAAQEQEAKIQYEFAAKRLMLETLRLVKRLRPQGRWGYYTYPQCENRGGRRKCLPEAVKLNDQLMWLFNESTGLYPSAYLKHSSYTRQQKIDLIYGRVTESKRIRALVEKKFNRTMPIYIYNRFQYKFPDNVFYSASDFHDTVGQPKSLGIDGTVLWSGPGITHNKTICTYIKKYVDTTLGPTVKHILDTDVTGYGLE